MDALAALAHPLRQQLLSLLREEGAATATELARLAECSSGLSSYHLRELAKHGFIEEVPDPTDRRVRRWRATAANTRLNVRDLVGRDGSRSALERLIGHQLEEYTLAVHDFIRGASEESSEWLDAVDSSDFVIELTADELTALRDEIHESIYRVRERSARSEQSEGRRVLFYVGAVPDDLPSQG